MKKAEDGKELTFKKIVDLYPGTSIWLVDIERCREQDKNARVMDKATFDRLKLNIKDDARLESLPLGYIEANPSGNLEFFIISGHHRIRAARMSEALTEIYVMVFDDKLTDDQVKSKQLAHNALAGYDDAQVLKELYESIKDVNEKIKAGIVDIDLTKEKYQGVSLDDIKLDFDFKVVKFMFLSPNIKKLDDAITELGDADKVYIENIEHFDKFTETLRQLSKNEDIRNISSILARMCEITLEHCAANPRQEKVVKAKKVPTLEEKVAKDKKAKA